jgi:acyl carrier protein
MLSSVVGNILGVLGEANYAATNTYLNSLATSNKNNSTHFVAVCPGIIGDVGIIAENDDAKKLLGRQGFQEMRSHDVIALVHYALSEEAKRSGCTEVTSGYRYQSFVQAGRSDALSNSFFSHLLQNANESRGSTVRKSTESIESLMANAKSREDAEAIVAQALASKIRTLVAQSEEEISTKQRVTDLGIDSLVLVELKNWITQTIKVRLQDPEIFDTGSIADLAVLLAERSPLVSQSASSNSTPSDGAEKPQVVKGESDHVRTDSAVDESELPKQPLPELDSSLELWLTVVRPGLSDKDYAEAVRLVEDLRRPGGQGRKLQARLTALACDPSVDNWQEELYNKFHYLKMRTPLVPQQNFAGTHYINRQQSAAERAAIIATAAHEFQQHLEGGKVNHQIDRGRKLEKNQYQWLFNTTRQPQRGEDVVKKYPDNNYLVALRRGWVFKIKLGLPLPVLKGHFQRIIVSRCEPASLVGVLTTDDREVWADNREILQCASEGNAEWLQTIEAAAFVICLDESMPETAGDRGHLFLQTGFNRWSDKTMQFVVCDNGMSATIGEHSMIDGYAARRLNSFIQDALESYSKTETADGHPETTLALEPFSFDLGADLERRIIASQDRLDQRTALNEFTAFEVSSVGSNFFRRHKIPPTAGVQVAIQLASRKYFGFNPFAHETVGQAHFKKGRIEVGHTVWAETRRFCEAAMNDMTSKGQLRQLYFNATKVQTNNLMRSTQGHGIDRHLLSLEWSVRDGETMPELFTSKVYTESRPKWFMTDCLESGVLEAHYIPAFQGGLWVHFEVDPEKVRFSLWAPVGEGLRFERHLEESASMVRAILDG